MDFRTERDPLGELQVPADAYYGVQTARAVENFPISGLRAPADLVTATILVKKAAAEANAALGRLDRRRRAARSSRPPTKSSPAQLRDQFVVDVYQAGAGTSHNMNANEVLANRAARDCSASRAAPTRACTRTITSTWASRPTTCSRRRRGWRCCSAPAPLVAAGARARRQPRAEGRRVRRRAEDRPHAPAGRRADHARPGVQRLRRVRRAAAPTMWRAASRAAAGAEHRRDRRRHRPQRRRRLPAARRRATSRATPACR